MWPIYLNEAFLDTEVCIDVAAGEVDNIYGAQIDDEDVGIIGDVQSVNAAIIDEEKVWFLSQIAHTGTAVVLNAEVRAPRYVRHTPLSKRQKMNLVSRLNLAYSVRTLRCWVITWRKSILLMCI